MAALPKKKCPKPGVMVKTRAGLVGITTGTCAKRRVSVALLGAGAATFTRGELKALTKKQTERVKSELNRAGRATPTAPAPVMRFPPRVIRGGAAAPYRPNRIPSMSHQFDPYA